MDQSRDSKSPSKKTGGAALVEAATTVAALDAAFIAFDVNVPIDISRIITDYGAPRRTCPVFALCARKSCDSCSALRFWSGHRWATEGPWAPDHGVCVEGDRVIPPSSGHIDLRGVAACTANDLGTVGRSWGFRCAAAAHVWFGLCGSRDHLGGEPVWQTSILVTRVGPEVVGKDGTDPHKHRVRGLDSRGSPGFLDVVMECGVSRDCSAVPGTDGKAQVLHWRFEIAASNQVLAQVNGGPFVVLAQRAPDDWETWRPIVWYGLTSQAESRAPVELVHED